MRELRIPIPAPIAMVVAVVIACICATTFVAAARGKSTVQRWEYHCVLPPGALPAAPKQNPTAHDQSFHNGTAHPAEKVLNYIGNKGWELVAIDPNNGHYCFKRRAG